MKAVFLLFGIVVGVSMYYIGYNNGEYDMRCRIPDEEYTFLIARESMISKQMAYYCGRDTVTIAPSPGDKFIGFIANDVKRGELAKVHFAGYFNFWRRRDGR